MTGPRVIRDAYWQVPVPVVRQRRRVITVRTVAVAAGAGALVSIWTLPEFLEPLDVARFAVSLVVLCAATCVTCYGLVDRWLP